MKAIIKKGIIKLENPIVDTENDATVTKVDLNTLIQKKMLLNSTVEGIPLNDEYTNISSGDDNALNINIDYKMTYTDEDGITMIGEVKKKNSTLFKMTASVDVDLLIEQAIDSLVKSGYKNINISRLKVVVDAVNDIKERVYKAAFENDILLSNEEFNYKIDIYKAGSNILLGTANRLLVGGSSMILFEVVALETNANLNRVDIKMIVDEKTAIQFKDLELNAESGKSIRYCSYTISNAKVLKKVLRGDETYNPTKMKMKDVKLPIKNMSTNSLLDDLMRNNSQDTLIRCYKQNKSMNIVKININKYLLV